ncbi:MAG: 16S rRNA (adenine(1518)-N(6)/adenine(1519)-N(6))-dimethyltransferase RsmA [Halobacteriales archaeon]|nr:16S rRNA (adenine(1518)-N(6)/adenine(1519)-N(6))-dimethyltransferase RsmA [Halobacteriales archaeon]
MTEKTDELMRRAGVRPEGTSDQHFLVDERVLDRIVGYAPETEDAHALEVGGGVGNLTQRLVERYDRVTVIELDRELARFLEDVFGDAVEVVQGDAVDVPLPEFDVSVSNLPYSASSPVLFRLLPRAKPLVVTVQKEFADRVVAEPGEDDYGRLSVTAGRYAHAEILETVPPSAFEPEPEVESAVLRFVPRDDVRGDGFFDDVVRAVFTQRRKTLRNAVRNTTHITGVDEERVYEVPEELLSKRPGKITPDEFERVADALRDEG